MKKLIWINQLLNFYMNIFTRIQHWHWLIFIGGGLALCSKILLVIPLVTSPNCRGKSTSSRFFFSGGLSCTPLFFEPLFSLGFHTSHRARIQYPFAGYSYILFGASKRVLVLSAPANNFRQSVTKIYCHITSEENDRNSSPLSGCSSKLRAFLLDKIPTFNLPS